MVDQAEIKKMMQAFLGPITNLVISPVQGGLINQSFKIGLKRATLPETYFLQKIDTRVFTVPQLLSQNYQLLTEHLRKHDYPYRLPKAWTHAVGWCYEASDGSIWRLWEYLVNTRSFATVSALAQVRAAARAMGHFYRSTQSFDPQQVQPSIAHFHDLNYYWKGFWAALKNDPCGRRAEVQALLSLIEAQADVVKTYRTLALPLRLIHGDPKLSNLLFASHEMKVVAIIDWDTLMPGTILMDYGDMIRSYTNPLGEESIAFDQIRLDWTCFEDLTEALLQIIAPHLHEAEAQQLYFGALWISLEQALRFMTDYLQGDIYYQTSREGQNWQRAKNQLCFYQSLLKHRAEAEAFIATSYEKYRKKI